MSPLFDLLLAELRRRFPERGLVVEIGEPCCARFPAAHAEVGDLVIQDDVSEVAIYFGNFTHCHYGSSKGDSPEGIAETVAIVVKELVALFDDRLKMWGGPSGGGVAPLEYDGFKLFGRFRLFRPKGRQFVWSGPLDAK